MKGVFLGILAVVLVVGLIFSSCAEPTPTPAPTTPAPTTPAPTTPAPTTPAPTTPAPTPTPTPAPTTPTTPQYGGILKIIVARSFASTIGYPPQVSGPSHWIAVPCLESLFRGTEDGTVIPWLVESWELAPDKNSYTLKLRKGVKFHDGTDFNAEAVKWNLQEIQKHRTDLDPIVSMDVLDEYTIRLNLKQFNNQLIFILSENCGQMASPTAIQNNGVDWAKTHPVGTGPFEFVSFERDVSVKYKKFDNYWQKDKPYLDGIEFSYVKDPTMAAMSFEAGEGQVLARITVVEMDSLLGKGYELVPSKRGSVWFFASDSANPDSPFADIKVREAIEFAIDREAIADGLGFGINQPAYQCCPPGYFGHNADIEGRLYDPTKAKQLLTEAGYADGFKTNLLTSPDARQDFLVAIQDYLRDVDIDANIQIESHAKWQDYTYNGWHNGLLWNPGVLFADSTTTLVKIYCSEKMVSTLRAPGVCDELVPEACATSNREEQIQLTKDAYRAIYDFAMVTPIWLETGMYVTLPSVHDHNFIQWSTDKWSPESLWLSK